MEILIKKYIKPHNKFKTLEEKRINKTKIKITSNDSPTLNIIFSCK